MSGSLPTPQPAEERSDDNPFLEAAITKVRMILLGTGSVTLAQVDEHAEGLARSVIGPLLAEVDRLRAENDALRGEQFAVCSECDSTMEAPMCEVCLGESFKRVRVERDNAREACLRQTRLNTDVIERAMRAEAERDAAVARAEAAEARISAITVETVAAALRKAGVEIGSVGGQAYREHVASVVATALASAVPPTNQDQEKHAERLAGFGSSGFVKVDRKRTDSGSR